MFNLGRKKNAEPVPVIKDDLWARIYGNDVDGYHIDLMDGTEQIFTTDTHIRNITVGRPKTFPRAQGLAREYLQAERMRRATHKIVEVR